MQDSADHVRLAEFFVRFPAVWKFMRQQASNARPYGAMGRPSWVREARAICRKPLMAYIDEHLKQ